MVKTEGEPACGSKKPVQPLKTPSGPNNLRWRRRPVPVFAARSLRAAAGADGTANG